MASKARVVSCMLHKIEADVGSSLGGLAKFCALSVPATKTVARELMRKGVIKVRRGGMYDNRQPYFRLAPGVRWDRDRQVYVTAGGTRVAARVSYK